MRAIIKEDPLTPKRQSDDDDSVFASTMSFKRRGDKTFIRDPRGFVFIFFLKILYACAVIILYESTIRTR